MIIVKEPKELKDYVKASAQSKIGLLVIEGLGGIGKSYEIKQALKGIEHLRLSSHMTPASFYEQLFYHKDLPIFINDIDRLFSNFTMTAIFKQLTETEKVKNIQYNSKTPLMNDLPREFETRSPVIIDANKLPGGKNKDFAALMTRGVHIYYAPEKETVLSILKSFAKDTTILGWIEDKIKVMTQIDLRKYLVAKQLRDAHLDWQKYLYSELFEEELAIVDSIGFSKTYKERSQEWIQRTGKSSRSYDRAVARYRKQRSGVRGVFKGQKKIQGTNNTT